jgi:hypothetical protein
MSTIRVHQKKTATPGQFLAGLTDFGPERGSLDGNGSEDALKEQARSADYADVTEGSGGFLGAIAIRLLGPPLRRDVEPGTSDFVELAVRRSGTRSMRRQSGPAPVRRPNGRRQG